MPHKDPEVRKAYLKAYNKLPKVIRKRKIYMADYRKSIAFKKWYYREDVKERRKEFDKKKRLKNKNKPHIIERRKKYHKKWYLKNRDKKLKQNLEWIKNNKIKVNEYKKRWVSENRDKIEGYQKKYKRKVGKELLRKRARKSLEKNREKRHLRKKERMQTDIQFKIRSMVSVRLRNGLIRFNKKKNKGKRTQDYLGCSYSYYVKYLEKKFKKGMSWKNFGRNGWEIDHIKPLAKFDLTKVNHQKKAFNFKNTQPLWRKENRSKGDKILN